MVDLHRALVESCDIYFYRLGKELGIDTIARYANMFGLGHKTGIDVGQEKAGLIPTREWKLQRWGVPWQAGETISTSIGQSFVLVTPIQMACFMACVFNGGCLHQPQVTMWVEDNSNQLLYGFNPKMVKLVDIEPEHFAMVRGALVDTVNAAGGTGGRARLNYVTVAGKTGTAQVVALEKEKKFADRDEIPEAFRDHAWFVGIAPAEDPEICVAVLVEHGGHGGSAAAPIAKLVIDAYLGETNRTESAHAGL
jgi:penicillin-binding protein 2